MSINSRPRKARVRPKPARPPGIDSTAEQQYLERLENQKRLGQIRNFYLKPGTFRTGNGTSYAPDFMVIQNDGTLEYHEVKGKHRFAQKGISKLRMVAHLFPDIQFVLVWVESATFINDAGKKVKMPTFRLEEIEP